MISTITPQLRICRAAVAAGLAVLALSGCSDARKALGYDKAPPDEFTVVSRAPLSQPPDFSLRPPTPGAPRPQEGTVRDQARGALLGSKAAGTGDFNGRSQGEKVMLAKSGADKQEPDVRRKVNEETTKLIEADNGFTDKILFWQEKPPPGEVVDAGREAKRLRDNAATGKSPADGSTPQIIRRRKGWLEDIF